MTITTVFEATVESPTASSTHRYIVNGVSIDSIVNEYPDRIEHLVHLEDGPIIFRVAGEGHRNLDGNNVEVTVSIVAGGHEMDHDHLIRLVRVSEIALGMGNTMDRELRAWTRR